MGLSMTNEELSKRRECITLESFCLKYELDVRRGPEDNDWTHVRKMRFAILEDCESDDGVLEAAMASIASGWRGKKF